MNQNSVIVIGPNKSDNKDLDPVLAYNSGAYMINPNQYN